ncbi:Hypothetical predicted protein [Mytilus galloprovincialis]|uniref:Farnesoic acid O-methyl transferase domain-containing protein n=1 Tax=Mytilus galloprovincialis TaxID=29158 RepID=A0A8B6CZZ4_MYTGA|nr:Hypothetical predicted protein [Mytilus galloprovincialis]
MVPRWEHDRKQIEIVLSCVCRKSVVRQSYDNHTVHAILSEVHIHTPNTGNGILSNPKAPELSIPLNQYGFNVSEKSSIFFEVKACEHAFIYLSESPVMNSTAVLYEIIIGESGGTRVILRKHNHVNVGVESLGSETTHCELFVSFWISCGNSNIKIGKGLIINQDIVIDWTEPGSVQYSRCGYYNRLW